MPFQISEMSCIISKSEGLIAMDDFLGRIRETNLSSAYTVECSRIAASSVERQLKWLQDLASKVATLDNSYSDFIICAINIEWKLKESAELRLLYQSFLVSLAMSQCNFYEVIIGHLLKCFIPDVPESEDAILRINPNNCSQDKIEIFNLAIDTIYQIHSKVPLSEHLILKKVNEMKPYFKKHPHIILTYVKSLLILGQKLPSLKPKLLERVVYNILEIDLQCPRKDFQPDDDEEEEEGVFSMDVDDTLTEEQKYQKMLQMQTIKRLKWIDEHPLVNSLDVLINCLMIYVHCVAHGVPFTFNYKADLKSLEALGCPPGNSDKTASKSEGNCFCKGTKHSLDDLKSMYVLFRDVFVKTILPTHSCSHIQYIMFYIIAIRPGLLTIFVEFLKNNYFINPSKGVDIRRNAMSYIGSFLVRCNFVSFSVVHSTLEVIANWCHKYIDNQVGEATNYKSVNLHSTFYAACQTLFYVFSFRYKEYVSSQTNLQLAKNLRFDHIVVCKLNPLVICNENIMSIFAALSRHYQLAYCYAIIEENKRAFLAQTEDYGPAKTGVSSISGNTLDVYFPFEPYLLPFSARHIQHYYQTFEGLPDHISTEADTNKTPPKMNVSASVEEDDFLEMSYTGTSMGKSFMD